MNKFQRLENEFRMFVAELILLSPPSRLGIVSRIPIGSIFAVMPVPCYIRELSLTGSLFMCEGILLYIFQYHILFPDLAQICYRPSSTDDVRDIHSALLALTTLDPPLIPTDVNRRILLTISHGSDTDADFKLSRSLVWDLSSPNNSLLI